ncbi:hypothetical protein FRC10_001661 [Ceratobasidium sp. 414]|nr:hypothetical protein FRC10_001661 [Ceratobasidium sp. 414]
MRIHSASSATSGASHNPASLALVEINIQLVKSTIVMVHGLRKRKDVVLATGVTSSDYQGVTDVGEPISSSTPMDGVRVVNGSVEIGGRSGSELSWEFPDFVEVKAAIDIVMKTHSRQEELYSDEDVDTDPSVGLFGAALHDGRGMQ